jgi:hypothetical protein
MGSQAQGVKRAVCVISDLRLPGKSGRDPITVPGPLL